MAREYVDEAESGRVANRPQFRERILNEETIVELATLVAEEIDAIAGEMSGRLEVIKAELEDVLMPMRCDRESDVGRYPPNAAEAQPTVAATVTAKADCCTTSLPANRIPSSRPIVITVTRHGSTVPARNVATSSCVALNEATVPASAKSSMPSLRTAASAVGIAASAGSANTVIAGASKPPAASSTPDQSRSEATMAIAKKVGSAVRKNAQAVPRVSVQTAAKDGTVRKVRGSISSVLSVNRAAG